MAEFLGLKIDAMMVQTQALERKIAVQNAKIDKKMAVLWETVRLLSVTGECDVSASIAKIKAIDLIPETELVEAESIHEEENDTTDSMPQHSANQIEAVEKEVSISLLEPSHWVEELQSVLLKNNSSQSRVGFSLDDLHHDMRVDVLIASNVGKVYVLDVERVEELNKKSVDASVDLVAHHLFDQVSLRVCSKRKELKYQKNWKFKYKHKRFLRILHSNEQHEFLGRKKIRCKMRMRQNSGDRPQYIFGNKESQRRIKCKYKQQRLMDQSHRSCLLYKLKKLQFSRGRKQVFYVDVQFSMKDMWRFQKQQTGSELNKETWEKINKASNQEISELCTENKREVKDSLDGVTQPQKVSSNFEDFDEANATMNHLLSPIGFVVDDLQSGCGSDIFHVQNFASPVVVGGFQETPWFFNDESKDIQIFQIAIDEGSNSYAYQEFDGMLQSNHLLHQHKQPSKFPKSWKFKFKTSSEDCKLTYTKLWCAKATRGSKKMLKCGKSWNFHYKSRLIQGELVKTGKPSKRLRLKQHHMSQFFCKMKMFTHKKRRKKLHRSTQILKLKPCGQGFLKKGDLI